MLTKLDYYLAIVLGVIFLSYFYFTGNMSAFQWPAIDMGSFFERYNDSSFLVNDFFTNSSIQSNPRYIFGYFVIALTTIFDTDWYTVFFSLKTLFIIILPILFFWTIVSITANKVENNTRTLLSIIVFLGTVLILNNTIVTTFSIAWWKPFVIIAVPQTLALVLGLLAMVLFFNATSKYKKFIVPILFFSATLIHPSISIFCLVFLSMINIVGIVKNKKYWFALFLFAIVVPGILLLWIYHVPEPLSAQEFVKYYAIENHSSHYLPSRFGSLTALPWWMSFGFVIVLIVCSALFASKKKDYDLLKLSLVFLLGYSGAVIVQYLFVELFPIKIIASLGPSRFTMFGYWMLIILYSILLLKCTSLVRIFQLLKWKNGKKIIKTSSYLAIPTMLIIAIFSSIAMTKIAKDSPFDYFKNKHQSLYNWVNQNTQKDTVFAIYFNELNAKFPLVMKRAVFAGNGFPFREDVFKEFQHRKSLIYGNNNDLDKYQGSWIGAKIAKFYRSLTPKKFVKISNKYRLDYVMVEANFSSAFEKFSPLFKNDKIKIYAIKQFKQLDKQ